MGIISMTEATAITTITVIAIRITSIEEERSRIKGRDTTDEITWAATDREAIKITKTTTTTTITVTAIVTTTIIIMTDKITGIVLIVAVIGSREGCQLSLGMVLVDSIRKVLYNAYSTLPPPNVIMMIEIAIIETILGVSRAITDNKTVAITITT